MFVHKYKTPLAVAALLAACVNIAPAHADYLINVVHNVLDTDGRIVQGTVSANGDIIDPSGRVVGHAAVGVLNPNGIVVDSRGNTVTRIYQPGSSTTVVSSTSTAAPVVFTDTLTAILDNRRVELEKMTFEGYRSGALSKYQEGDFRTSLERIQTAENNSKASGGVLSYDEALDVARDLDSLAANISSSSKVNPLSPLIVIDASGATRFAVAPSGYFASTYTSSALPRTTQTTVTNTLTPGGDTITKTTETKYGGTSVVVSSESLLSSLDSRREAISSMMNDGLSNGKLSPSQVADLRAELDNISRDELTYKSSDGALTMDEAITIGARLDGLSNRIATTMSVQPLNSIIVMESGTRRIELHPTNTYTLASSPSVVQTTTTTTAPGTVITSPSGTAVVTSTPAGSVVTVRTITPQVYVSTLDVRRSELQKLIIESRDKKVMDRTKADAMLAELERIHQQTVPTISYGRAVLLARDLDMVGTQVLVVTPGLPIPQPIISGSHLTISNGQIATMDDVSVRRSDLEGRITKDFLQGRLSSAQADELRTKMNSIDTMEAQFRQPNGDISLKESRILYSHYDKVASDLDRFAGKENK